MMTSSEGPYF